MHHDLWDYDVPAQPTLFEFPGGGAVPALAQGTKWATCSCCTARRASRSSPWRSARFRRGGVEGETLSPTQPFPTASAAAASATLTPDDAWGFTPWDRGKCREKIERCAPRDVHAALAEGSVDYPGMSAA